MTPRALTPARRTHRSTPGRPAVLCGTLWLLLGGPSPVSAQAKPFEPLEGGFLDVQFVGGVGAGLDAVLAEPVMAQLRLGAGWAHEPWFVNGGLTGTLGGLGSVSAGLEVELNHLSGPYLQVGAAYTRYGGPLVHATLGFAVLGVQYQYLHEGPHAEHALLGVLRLPIGTWWFLEAKQRSALKRIQTLRSGGEEEPRQASVVADGQAVSQKRAELAYRQGLDALAADDPVAAEQAFTRSLSFLDDPTVRLARADLREAEGRLVDAREDVYAVLTRWASTWAESDRIALEARHRELGTRIGLLRLTLPEVPGLQVEVDGLPAAAAVLGYDWPLDPGPHSLRVLAETGTLLEREIEAKPGEITRVLVPDPKTYAP